MAEEKRHPFIIGIDFDGTIVEHRYPDIGRPCPGALETIKELIACGHRIILWTMRGGEELRQAINFLTKNDITLFCVNYNPEQREWTDSPKAYCHLYIDDAALGCPLEDAVGTKRQRVNWTAVRAILDGMDLLTKQEVV